ncbi:hypothetical protein T439DRAFT_360024 [Meredithblackwellia eburnea MCA 4105]
MFLRFALASLCAAAFLVAVNAKGWHIDTPSNVHKCDSYRMRWTGPAIGKTIEEINTKTGHILRSTYIDMMEEGYYTFKATDNIKEGMDVKLRIYNEGAKSGQSFSTKPFHIGKRQASKYNSKCQKI